MSGRLNIEPALERPDDFYQALIDAHRGLSDEQSGQVNCRLVLLLANHIGDIAVLAEALDWARRGIEPLSDATPAPPESRPAR